MSQKTIKVRDIEISNDKPMVLFGGMNVLEAVIWQCVLLKSTKR